MKFVIHIILLILSVYIFSENITVKSSKSLTFEPFSINFESQNGEEVNIYKNLKLLATTPAIIEVNGEVTQFRITNTMPWSKKISVINDGTDQTWLIRSAHKDSGTAGFIGLGVGVLGIFTGAFLIFFVEDRSNIYTVPIIGACIAGAGLGLDLTSIFLLADAPAQAKRIK